MKRIYLDWNATAPLRDEAKAAMLAAMEIVGNPSSVHAEGRAAKALRERARGQIAAGRSRGAVARDLNVHRATVGYAVAGKTWRHVQ